MLRESHDRRQVMAVGPSLSASATSTSTSTRASSAHAFPILTHRQAHLLERIVARTQDGATTFADIFGLYHAVLEEAGVNVGADEEIYSLLLKLSASRGKDWKDKWQGVLSEQALESVNGRAGPEGTGHRGGVVGGEASTSAAVTNAVAAGARPVSPRPSRPRPLSVPASTARALEDLRQPGRQPLLPAHRPRPSPIDAKAVHSEQESPLTSPTKSSHPHLHDPALATAAAHHRLQTLSRAFRLWRGEGARWSAIASSVALARTRLSQAGVLQRWRAKVGKRQRELAVVHRVEQSRLRDLTWMRWRQALEDRRRRRWGTAAQSLVVAFTARRDSEILQGVFLVRRLRHPRCAEVTHARAQRWYRPALATLLFRRHQESVLHAAFAVWQRAEGVAVRREQQTQAFIAASRLARSRAVLVAWSSAAERKRKERAFRASMRSVEASKWLRTWRITA